MATTERLAAYHEPLVERYVRFNYPEFTEEQISAILKLAKVGGIELCAMHEVALAKFLQLSRQSGDGFDLICKLSDKTVEAKYKRLVLNSVKNGSECWCMKLGTKELQGKTADYLWITVYNQFIDEEDHFYVPFSYVTGKSFTFAYNREKDDYNRGQKFHVMRGPFTT